MKEASLVKFYLARYFFLAFASLQMLACLLVAVSYPTTARSRFALLLFLLFALLLLTLHFSVFARLRRVALGKKKIVIKNSSKRKTYAWQDVKDLQHHVFLNVYSLQLKGKRGKVYFLPRENSQAVFGLFADKVNLPVKK